VSDRPEIVKVMKILIAGGHGQLGRELFQECQTRDFDVLVPSHHQMDITDIKAVKNFIDLHQPTWVINAAAYTQVDKAESEESLAFAVNKTGSTNLAQICAKNEIPLFQVSTDYVFDGQKNAPYHESDPISPIGVYGRSKAAGETEIRSNLKEHIILRTSWLYGVHGQNFVKTMLKLAKTKEIIRVVSDQYGGPTSAGDLAKAILVMAVKWRRQSVMAWGTYHYCGQGIVSWYEFAEAIIELARRYMEVKTNRVEPITTADYPTKARRPAFSALDCNLIKKNFGINPKPWRESLKYMIQRLFERTAAVDGTLLENSPR
jgi:dTDP-4-dehydrorhamnose reductase